MMMVGYRINFRKGAGTLSANQIMDTTRGIDNGVGMSLLHTYARSLVHATFTVLMLFSTWYIIAPHEPTNPIDD
jgi:hypothetical protein